MAVAVGVHVLVAGCSSYQGLDRLIRVLRELIAALSIGTVHTIKSNRAKNANCDQKNTQPCDLGTGTCTVDQPPVAVRIPTRYTYR